MLHPLIDADGQCRQIANDHESARFSHRPITPHTQRFISLLTSSCGHWPLCANNFPPKMLLAVNRIDAGSVISVVATPPLLPKLLRR
jgi:hypothetical protein